MEGRPDQRKKAGFSVTNKQRCSGILCDDFIILALTVEATVHV